MKVTIEKAIKRKQKIIAMKIKKLNLIPLFN